VEKSNVEKDRLNKTLQKQVIRNLPEFVVYLEDKLNTIKSDLDTFLEAEKENNCE
jgi:hypothetical protein